MFFVKKFYNCRMWFLSYFGYVNERGLVIVGKKGI